MCSVCNGLSLGSPRVPPGEDRGEPHPLASGPGLHDRARLALLCRFILSALPQPGLDFSSAASGPRVPGCSPSELSPSQRLGQGELCCANTSHAVHAALSATFGLFPGFVFFYFAL